MSANPLNTSDVKITKRRQAVLNILEKAADPMAAEDIYTAVLKDVHMSLSTTYRTLGTLSENGLIAKNVAQDGKTYYQMNNPEQHKHHLVCTLCHDSVQVDECPLHNLEQNLMDKTGFTITGHNLEIKGICPKCAHNENNKSKT